MNKRLVLLGIVIILILLLSAVVLAKPKTPPGQAKFEQTTPVTTTTPTSESDQSAQTTQTASSAPATTSSAPPSSVASTKDTNWEMIGAIVGILAIMGAVVGWFFAKRQKSKTSNYLREINTTYNQLKSDTSKCEANLYLLKERIEKEYTSGKIDEQGIEFLHRRIDTYLKNVRMGIVDNLDISPEAKKELAGMLKDGRISEEEYDSFTSSKKLSKKDIEKVQAHLSKWKKKDKADK
ncbi:MAG: hypothetical protein KJ574_00180 [Nanoarchaeota archaeon]|nr:hypothetical protein [Nanoarchaeota archaeon]